MHVVLKTFTVRSKGKTYTPAVGARPLGPVAGHDSVPPEGRQDQVQEHHEDAQQVAHSHLLFSAPGQPRRLVMVVQPADTRRSPPRPRRHRPGA